MRRTIILTSLLISSCGGGGGGGGGETPPDPQAISLSLSISPTAIATGQTATLLWQSQNAANCVASGDWSDAKPVSGSQIVGPISTPGAYNYSLTCSGAQSSPVTRTASLTVSQASSQALQWDQGNWDQSTWQ